MTIEEFKEFNFNKGDLIRIHLANGESKEGILNGPFIGFVVPQATRLDYIYLDPELTANAAVVFELINIENAELTE